MHSIVTIVQVNGIIIREILIFLHISQVGPKEVLDLTDAEFLTLGVTTIGEKVKIRAACTAFMSAGKGKSIIYRCHQCL